MTDLLIVIDMQRDFVSGALGSPEARAITPAVAARIRRAKKEGTPVVLTLDTHETNYMDTREGRFLPVPHCIRDTQGWTLEPEIAAEWHPTLNGALTPGMVTDGSRKKVWWQCSMGHVWKSVIYPRTGAQQCGCPVCAGKVSTAHARRYAQLDEIRTFTEL